jgi:hypothetical protein
VKNACPALNGCGGIGVCFHSRCFCPQGFSGLDCSTVSI